MEDHLRLAAQAAALSNEELLSARLTIANDQLTPPSRKHWMNSSSVVSAVSPEGNAAMSGTARFTISHQEARDEVCA
ncbi:hypothetical protein [Sphingobium sp.]|uniref:hypothetical protein n=1 Tax=Sphingobium sp. TaxID=1912891 RepID=UPI002B819DCE|nr:hypothetical protein [Sphingobium sp.]HUD95333.1 hypothetical protein [Sphingobium sp.]